MAQLSPSLFYLLSHFNIYEGGGADTLYPLDTIDALDTLDTHDTPDTLHTLNTLDKLDALDTIEAFLGKATSLLNISGHQIDFVDEAEHVGIVRSVAGNLPHLLSRFVARRRVMFGILGNMESSSKSPSTQHILLSSPSLWNVCPCIEQL